MTEIPREAERLRTLAQPTADHLARLHAILETRAEAAGLIDVAYATADSPLGRLLIAATPLGIVRIAFESQGFDDVLSLLSERVSPRVLEAPARLDLVRRELDEYFAGTRTGFDVSLDRSLSHGFRRQVHEHLPAIAYGSTQSYAEVARDVGRPKAVRAVGTACAVNPLPIIVPCHRVLRSDGTTGGYAGGPEAKALLLDLEATSTVTDRR
ncbi:methylated-DNA--[protein]-cysteine S-methyltransferase [Paramicrobacterium fandaimingii]|uniref:methylated-DNA--[protein]-cysteine S-methyltransferase n=1 Tax=Paramicrobacterium fandaimingii TaxID=2708079 RepID=UPI00141FF6E1|nr:methylated-DNA--[protein]-cysteine S-methyltransferase [Microbacterium fandaimingii]